MRKNFFRSVTRMMTAGILGACCMLSLSAAVQGQEISPDILVDGSFAENTGDMLQESLQSPEAPEEFCLQEEESSGEEIPGESLLIQEIPEEESFISVDEAPGSAELLPEEELLPEQGLFLTDESAEAVSDPDEINPGYFNEFIFCDDFSIMFNFRVYEGQTLSFDPEKMCEGNDYLMECYLQDEVEFQWRAKYKNGMTYLKTLSEAPDRLYYVVNKADVGATFNLQIKTEGKYLFYSSAIEILPDDQCGDKAYWKFDSASGTLTITGSGAMYDYPEGRAPWSAHYDNIKKIVVGKGISRIGQAAFFMCGEALSAAIPDSVTSIGAYSFGMCEKLEAITVPDSVKEMGRAVFMECSRLKSVKLSSNITLLRGRTFDNCNSLTSITIPGKVKEIENYAFMSCSHLATVELLPGIEKLGSAFVDCYELQLVWIPRSVTQIDEVCFYHCHSEMTVRTPAGSKASELLKGVDCLLEHKEIRILQDISDLEAANIEDKIYAGKPVTQKPLLKVGSYTLTEETDYSVGYENNNKVGTAKIHLVGKGNYFGQITDTFEILPPFKDVPKGKYYYEPVYWAVEKGITTGYKKNGKLTGYFGPDDPCTREQIVTFLWRYRGAHEPGISTVPFKDCKKDAYYYKAVCWAYENNITKGVSSDKFGIGEPCTREMTVTFIYRFADAYYYTVGSGGTGFKDVKKGSYYENAVGWAVEMNITTGYLDQNGKPTGKFGTGDPCTRGQIVTFLNRYSKLL